jgi:DNA-binding NarL/FixJ family response regulator
MNPGSSETVARKSRVFVVDDHPLVREGLANLLNAQDDLMVCGDAEDSPQAINRIRTARPDVALIDISLKNESGLELVKQLRSQFPQVALIVLSMHDEALYAERVLCAGAQGYVMKREASKNVLASIRRVLDGGVYVSGRVTSRMALRLSSPGKTASSSPVECLRDREMEILRLLGQGRTTYQTAGDLHMHLTTVQAYCARAKEKFGVTTLVDLLRAAIRWEDASRVK